MPKFHYQFVILILSNLFLGNLRSLTAIANEIANCIEEEKYTNQFKIFNKRNLNINTCESHVFLGIIN